MTGARSSPLSPASRRLLRPGRIGFARAGACAAVLAGGAVVGAGLAPALAAGMGAAADSVLSGFAIDLKSTFGLAVVTGIVMFAVVLSIQHIREREHGRERERGLAAEIARLRDMADRVDVLLGAERQAIVVWNGPDGAPTFEGEPAAITGETNPRRILAFGSWLRPADAARLEGALDRLRTRGESFRLTLAAQRGSYVDAEGRALNGRALLRLRDVTADRAATLLADESVAAARADLADLRSFVDALDAPVWLRTADGRLDYANPAYCRAVEAGNGDDVRARSLELLERSDREASTRRREAGERFQARVAAVMAGQRRMLDITEVPLPRGSGGIAQDVTETDTLRADLSRQRQSQIRTLDQLPTAVAMFDAKQRLVFHNAAYRQLWDLDTAFLDGWPSESEILDRLRADRKLPEEADFRAWKARILSSYLLIEPQESWWYLPDRRTLRVIANPNPQGGLTYLFHDVSDRMQLESRYNALIRVQGETLNTLREGVALFAADGRLKLFNKAFAALWRLDEAVLGREPHIEEVVRLASPLSPADESWSDLRSAVSGLPDVRLRTVTRMERIDGSVLECAAEPLPDGATLLTFADSTASVNVERALTERNEALELASQVRNEFVHHVSYELRSPLTTIIGFAELLGAETIGALNTRQREYADHITRSSGALLAIINDILDLASIDADTIELVREPVDIRDAIQEAARGLDDRLVESGIRLDVDAPAAIGTFEADGKRIRQILFNLLSNAVGFSAAGQTIKVVARRSRDEIVIAVADQGRGIPADMQARVFERFESNTRGSAHRGVGLGLPIVRALVELHGGRVELNSEQDRGTMITCFFPADGRPRHQIAAE